MTRGTLLLLIATLTCPGSASEYTDGSVERSIYFKLEAIHIAANGLPDSDWAAAIIPSRDAQQDQVSIERLPIPDQILRETFFRDIFRIETPAGYEPTSLLSAISALEGVIWAEIPPERLTSEFRGKIADGIDAPPDDPMYSLQYYLDIVRTPAAWDVSHGDTSITIAVIDVGTDIRHGDLMQKVWTNWMEANGDSAVDDDGNGYIDDIHGWDFMSDDADPNPSPDDNHGTHVAGIACAGTDNGFGIAGVGWDCRVMPIRVGVGRSIVYGFEGLVYAAANGADVINISWGGNRISQLERVAIDWATEKGCLIVAAAGNLVGSEPFNHYPAGYDNAIAVASTDDHDNRSSFSNIGTWVDISAPGSRILSLFTNQRYGIEDGTSMACPLVAGAAGLLKAYRPDWTPARLRAQLESTADPIDAYNGIYAGKLGSGRLNLYRALTEINALVTIQQVHVTESNGDGIIDPGERIQVYFDLYNPQLRSARFSMRMVSDSPLLGIENLVYDSLTIDPGGTFVNDNGQFRARVSANSGNNINILCHLEITDDSEGIYRLPFQITVRQQYSTIKNDRIAFTVSDMGSLGFYDYPVDSGRGDGFRFPANGLSALFHGSLMVGSTENRVSDNAYGNRTQNRHDFIPLRYGVTQRISEGEQILMTHFSDEGADTNALGLDIRQTTSISLEGLVINYALLEYEFTLQQGYPELDSVIVGLYLDWDINYPESNRVHWDTNDHFGWMQSITDHPSPENSSVFGVGLVNRDALFYAAINRADVANEWSDVNKSNMFRSRFDRAEGRLSKDWAQMIGAGPFSLAMEETLRVVFAIAGGESLAQITNAVRAARERYGIGGFESGGRIPEGYGLVSIYPLPFNSTTTVLCRLSYGAGYNWLLSNSLGREVQRGGGVVTRRDLVPVLIEGKELAAGYYIFNLKSAGSSYSRPIILLK